MKDIFTNIWESIPNLKSLSSWLQWISIAMVFVSGGLQIGRYVVDRREKYLSSIEHTKELSPFNKPIRTGTAKIKIIVASSKQINTRHLDRGCVLFLGQNGTILLSMSSIDSFEVQNGNNELIWSANLNLDIQDISIGKQVDFLKNANLLQMGFLLLPPASQIKSGRAIITLNSAVTLTFDIPQQFTLPGQGIIQSFFIVPNIAPILAQQIKEGSSEEFVGNE